MRVKRMPVSVDEADTPGPRLRLAIVSDAIFPYHRGGKESRYHEVIQRISTRIDVDIYTMRWWEETESLRLDGARLHAISPLLPLYVNDRRSLTQALRFGLACFRMLKYDFDVLEADHIPFFQVLVLRLVTAIKRKPLIVTWHEVWGRAYWRQYLGPLGLAAWLIEELAMRAPDHIIAASPQTAERLRKSIGAACPITVIPNGIDLEEVASAYADSVPTDVAVVGRLIAHKRVDILLEAIAKLRAEGLPLTCRVIGNGPEELELHKMAERLAIDDLVEFRHDVTEQKDVYGLLKAARVCAFPTAREGFGIAVLEALACGVPVITTSTTDNMAQHLVARSVRGVVCEPTVDALANSLRAVLSGEAVAAGRPESWLNEYSWAAAADKIAQVLGAEEVTVVQRATDVELETT
jgi:glycosyltransferase involved in cell wall biosynthesis